MSRLFVTSSLSFISRHTHLTFDMSLYLNERTLIRHLEKKHKYLSNQERMSLASISTELFSISLFGPRQQQGCLCCPHKGPMENLNHSYQ